MKAKRRSLTLHGSKFNFSITPDQMAKAIAKVDAYSVPDKIRRMDDVFATQPALLGAAVQLSSLGVDLGLIDHAFHVLLVLFECFSTFVPKLPKVAPETVQKAFDDIAKMQRLFEGVSDEEARRLQLKWAREHQEQAVFAFVVSYLDSNLTDQTREQELVRNCCLAMMNAYLATYQAMP